jgi:hypothetical protein
MSNIKSRFQIAASRPWLRGDVPVRAGLRRDSLCQLNDRFETAIE